MAHLGTDTTGHTLETGSRVSTGLAEATERSATGSLAVDGEGAASPAEGRAAAARGGGLSNSPRTFLSAPN